jgi:hypothetical protein
MSSGTPVQITKQFGGRTQPLSGGSDLLRVPAVLVIAVLCSLWGAAAVSAAVHSAPPPPDDWRRLARPARSSLGSAAGGL